MLDTGFNGELLMAANDVALFGFRQSEIRSKVELAGGRVYELRRGLGEIVWLGRRRRVELLISADPPQPRRDGDPIALVGTRLLAPNLLLIDFTAATVEIEAQE